MRYTWAQPVDLVLLGPQALSRSEFIFATRSHAGFTGAALTAAAAAISNLVIGSVAAEAAWHRDTEIDIRDAMHKHLETHTDRYPTLAALPRDAGAGWARAR